jgi:hypothetical protein
MRGTWGTDLARKAIFAFAIVNALLFSALLPLWEGFDEAFHYGYVEELWQSRRLPVLGRTPLPYEVAASFQLAPVSSVARRAMPEAIPYDEWFSLPDAKRERRRHELERLTADQRSSSHGNYEAHQPPLAYLLLAPLDWSMDWSIAKLPFTARVLALRLFCGVSAVVLLFFGASALCRVLEVPERFAAAALFGVFCSEMFYASTAHVANDWLAIGVSAFFLAGLAGFVRAPGRRTALTTAAWLAAGLLTKAYFLVFAAVALAVAIMVVWQRRGQFAAILPAAALVVLVAGPWYARNLVVYGSVGASPEQLDGIGIRQALAAVPRIDWPATAGYLARASLWTGNNWFNSYSRATLNLLLVLLALGLVACGWRRRAAKSAERAIFAAMTLFLGAVAYEGCAMVADRPDQMVAGPSPWYTQVLLAPLVALAFLGFANSKRAGRILAAATTTLWAWILVATWMLKLFPMYAGGGSGAMRAKDVWNWWVRGAAAHAQVLSTTALAPAGWLYAALVVALALTIAAWVLVIKALSDQS